MKNQRSNSPINMIRLSALALLALILIALVGCDKEAESGVDISQEERDREVMKIRKPDPDPSPAPSVQPIDPFYGDLAALSTDINPSPSHLWRCFLVQITTLDPRLLEEVGDLYFSKTRSDDLSNLFSFVFTQYLFILYQLYHSIIETPSHKNHLMSNLNSIEMVNQISLTATAGTTDCNSNLWTSIDMKKLSLTNKFSTVLCSSLLILSSIVTHAATANAMLDQSSQAKATCQTSENTQTCHPNRPQSRKLVAYSDARLQFSWRAAPLETAQIVLELIRNGNIIGVGMVLLFGNDVYVVKPKLVNTGEVPLRIHPWNMTVYYGNRYVKVLPITDSRFMQPDTLRVGYQIEGLVAFIAPSGLNVLEDFKIGYTDDSIEIEN